MISTGTIPELDRDGLRRFGLTFGGIVAGIFGVAVPLLFSLEYRLWPWVVLAVFGAWALAAPQTMAGFYRLWMRFGLVMNFVMTRLVLGIVFYLVVWPIGAVMRLFGHDPMARRLDAEAESYRVPSTPPRPNHLERPF